MTLLRHDRAPLVLAGALAFLTAAVGGLATHIGPWYYALKKPAWQPPDWLFGPVWTVIFALCAIAAAKAWGTAETSFQKRSVLGLFLVNGVLNVLWSALFFSLRRPDLALAEVALLWLSVTAIIVFIGRWATVVRWLMLPYLVWVSFAAILNLEIVRLNQPFS
jgi:tryptophan-rich sensory protein